MDKESIHINLTVEKSGEFAQAIHAMHAKLMGEQTARQRPERCWTVDERCRQHWPQATQKQRQRIRNKCRVRYRERVGRDPYKQTECINAPFVIEEEHLPILDGAINTVRNEDEAREAMPLFRRQLH